jgi:hypothetical protein
MLKRRAGSTPPFDPLPHSWFGEIALGQQEAVGHRGLLHRLGLLVEGEGAVDGIDRRYDAIEHVARRNDRIGHQGVQDRRGVRETGRLDRDAGEIRDLAFDPIDKQGGQGIDNIAADCAAEAAAVEQHDILARAFDEKMIEANLAELVNDNRCCRHARLFQHVIEYGRLAAAEKTGQQGHWDQG